MWLARPGAAVTTKMNPGEPACSNRLNVTVGTCILSLKSYMYKKEITSKRLMNKEARYLETVMLNGRSQSQRTTCCSIPFICKVQERPIGGNRK